MRAFPWAIAAFAPMLLIFTGCNDSISDSEIDGIRNMVRKIGSNDSFKFEVKKLSDGLIKNETYKLVEVKYTYPQAPHPRQCIYVLYHQDEEAGMLKNMVVGLGDYMKGGCDMKSGCFGCDKKTFYETVKKKGYSGKIDFD